MTSTFDAVRNACSPQLWSRGIELVRADAVIGERAEADEVAVRVATKGGMIARNVHALPRRWRSGSARAAPPSASTRPPRSSPSSGRTTRGEPPSPGSGRARSPTAFPAGRAAWRSERGVRVGDAFHPFEATLAALSSGRSSGSPQFTARQNDLAAELALGHAPARARCRGRSSRSFCARSSGATSVASDGAPVRTLRDPGRAAHRGRRTKAMVSVWRSRTTRDLGSLSPTASPGAVTRSGRTVGAPADRTRAARFRRGAPLRPRSDRTSWSSKFCLRFAGASPWTCARRGFPRSSAFRRGSSSRPDWTERR